MGIKRACAAVLIAAGVSGAAWAETPTGNANGRYTMSPVEGGFLRLDTETGAVAMCARSGVDDWACKPVEDTATPQALSPSPSEISRLEQENKELKDRIHALEEPSTPPGGKAQLPTDEEIDQALGYMERVYKKFRDRIKNLEKPDAPPIEAPPPKGSL